jgi:aminopeptidase N
VTASGAFDAASGRYTLTLQQMTKPTPGQPDKRPLPIPVAMGLLAPDGREVAARDLLLEATTQDFVFEGLDAPPVPSLLRGFSAPVRLGGLAPEQLRHLAAHDTDPVVRWDSLQEYATLLMLRLIADQQAGRALHSDDGLVAAVAAALDRADEDPAFAAECVVLPGEAALASRLAQEDPDAVFAVRQFLRRDLGTRLRDRWHATYVRLSDTDPVRFDGAAMGARALRNVALAALSMAGDEDGLAETQFAAAMRPGGNMTELLAALDVLASGDSAARGPALEAFHARWRHDPLVLDKWFAIQAMSRRETAVAAVEALWTHPDFDLRNPNRVRSLVASFAIPPTAAATVFWSGRFWPSTPATASWRRGWSTRWPHGGGMGRQGRRRSGRLWSGWRRRD